MSTPLRVSEASRASMGVGHVVGVDLVVALVGHVHHVAVGPDAPWAVVAGLRQFPGLSELFVTDAFEFPGVPIGGFLVVGQRGQPVGDEPLLAVVGDPDTDAIGPDAVGVAVGRVQGELAEQVAASEVVGEEAVLAPVQDPHRLALAPDAAGRQVATVERDVALRQALAARQVMGEEEVAAAVRDPDDGAVGADAARRAVCARRARTRAPRRAHRSRGHGRRFRRRRRRRSRGARAWRRRTTSRWGLSWPGSSSSMSCFTVHSKSASLGLGPDGPPPPPPTADDDRWHYRAGL